MSETTKNVNAENLSSKKDKILTFLRIFLSIIFIVFLILKNQKNFNQIYSSLINIRAAFLSIAVLIYFVSLLAESVQWNIMLRAQKIKVSQLFLLQSMMIGFFYNNLLPSNIGGDFYRVLDVSKNKRTSLEKNISAVFLERFFGLISITLYFLISSFTTFKVLGRSAIIILIFLVIAFLLFSIIIKPRFFKIDKFFARFKRLSKFEKEFNSFNEILTSYRDKWIYIIGGMIFNLIAQTLVMVSYYFIVLSLEIKISFMLFFLIVPVIFVLTGIPISIGGLGVRENTFVFLLKKFGVSNDLAVAASFLVLFTTIFNALLGGIIYLTKSIFYKSKSFI